MPTPASGGALRRRTALLLSALALAAALTGCLVTGSALAPTSTAGHMAAMSVTPHLTEDAFVAADGTPLPLYRWTPANWGWAEAPRAVFVAFHGFNDYANAFSGAAPEWARLGIATYAVDQRGFGRNPDRGEWAGSNRMIADARILIGLVKAAHPGVPVYALGESMGGAVVMAALTGAGGAGADGAVLVAPALWGRQVMSPLHRAALWVAQTVMPQTKFTGKGLKRIASDNVEMLRALGRDPYVVKGSSTASVAGLVDMMGLGLDAAAKLDVPALVLYGANEQIVDARAVREGLRRLSRVPHTVAVYPAGYHMLLRDRNGPQVVQDIAAWVLDRRVPLPSGHRIFPPVQAATY